MSRSTVSVICTLSVIGVSGLLAGDSGGAEGIALRRKFKPGQTNYYVIEREDVSRQSLAPLLPTPRVTRRNVTDVIIESIRKSEPDGWYLVDWTVDRVQFHRSDENEDVRFDSVCDSPTAETRPIASVVGKVLTGKVRATGDARVGGAAGSASSDESSNGSSPRKVAATAATRSRPSRRPAGRSNVAGYYDRYELPKTMARWTTEFLPADDVRVGDSWSMSYAEPKQNVGNLVHEIRCTLAEVRTEGSRELAIINVDGECRIEEVEEPKRPSTRTAKPEPEKEIDAKLTAWTGQISFDMTAGRVAELTLRHENDISVRSNGGGMEIVLGSAEQRVFRMKSQDELPPKPIVVMSTQPDERTASTKSAREQQRTAAERSRRRMSTPATRRVSSRPVRERPKTNRRTASRPATRGARPLHRPPGATTRPARGPKIPATNPWKAQPLSEEGDGD